jgi:cyclohexanecarboxylate-CoA ligase
MVYESPIDGSLWDLMEWRTSVSPSLPLLIDEQRQSDTFGDVAQRAEAMAAQLWTMGVRPGSVVAWQLPTLAGTVILSLALCRLGACQVPMIPQYRLREVAFILRQTAADYFVIPRTWNGFGYAELADEAVRELTPPPVRIPFEVLLDPPGDRGRLPAYPSLRGRPEETRWIYYTSGTTSDPKGAAHSDRSILAAALALAEAFPRRRDDVGCIAFPLAHIGGVDHLGCMLIDGFPALLMESFRPTSLIRAMRDHAVTLGGGGVAVCREIVQQQRRSPDARVLPSLRMLIAGGASKSAQFFHDVKQTLGVPLIPGYGMTEAPTVAMGSTQDSDDDLAVTDGRVCRGMEVLIDDTSDAGPGEQGVGEICLRGDGVFAGYIERGLNAEAFDKLGYFRTGDLGFIRSDGMLTVTGRIKDVIIRKGETISVRDVEDALAGHPGVEAAAVVGLPDERSGERVCAVIESAGGTALTFEEMQAYCRAAGLMVQKIPEQLVVVDRLPRNASGKIRKDQLRLMVSAAEKAGGPRS